MATIGTFTQNENGAGFTGAVKTLTLNVKAKFVLSEADSERGPDFRIFAGATEFGVNRRAKRTPYRRPKGTPLRSSVTGMTDAAFALVAA